MKSFTMWFILTIAFYTASGGGTTIYPNHAVATTPSSELNCETSDDYFDKSAEITQFPMENNDYDVRGDQEEPENEKPIFDENRRIFWAVLLLCVVCFLGVAIWLTIICSLLPEKVIYDEEAQERRINRVDK